MTIKTPVFDKTFGTGTTGERHRIDSTVAPIEVGTDVLLIYKGKNMNAVVAQVEKPGSVFVGRVEAFDRSELEHADLKHGDMIRFSREDISWIG